MGNMHVGGVRDVLLDDFLPGGGFRMRSLRYHKFRAATEIDTQVEPVTDQRKDH